MSGCKMSIIQFFANLLLLIGSIILRKQIEVVAPRSVAGLLCLPLRGCLNRIEIYYVFTLSLQ